MMITSLSILLSITFQHSQILLFTLKVLLALSELVSCSTSTVHSCLVDTLCITQHPLCVCVCACVCVCTVRPSLLPPFFVSSSSMYRSIQCQKCPALPYSPPFLLFLPFHNHSVCLEMWQPLWNASSPLTSPPSSLPPFSTTFLSPISSASFLPSIFSSVCYTTIIQPHTRDETEC